MIDIKELNIGNKVKYKDSIVEIAATHLTSNVGILGAFQSMIVSVKCEEIEPIEVTEELLVKIGFEKNEIVVDGYHILDITYDYPLGDCFIEIRAIDRNWYCQINNYAHSTMGDFDFKYLHELQNGIRLVTKKDLEICL